MTPAPRVVPRLAAGLLAATLAACGGGGSGSSPPPTFRVTTAVDSGLSLAPASATVEQGRTASFTATFKAGRGFAEIGGCGGTLSGNAYTTGPITADCVVSATSKVTYALNAIRLRPNALFHDEFATAPVTLEVVTSGGSGIRLFADYPSATFDNTRPATTVRVPLHDDGTHGDRIAGDGIYTATFATGLVPRLRYHDRTVDRVGIGIRAYDEADVLVQPTNANVLINSFVYLGAVHRSVAVATLPVADGMVAAPNMVSIVMPDAGNGFLTGIRKLYTRYPDAFDGVAVVILGTTAASNIPSGGRAKNTVSGINVVQYDDTATYGSEGRLTSAASLAEDIVGEAFLHEFGHATMFYLNNPALELTGGNAYHAGICTTIGQMSQSKVVLKERADGNFEFELRPAETSSLPYSDTELYLLGLLPPQSVQPQHYLTDGTFVTLGQVVPRDKVRRVAIGDIVAVYGPRVPSAAESPKSFRVAFIALSETPATPAEIALVNRVAAFYESDLPGADEDRAGLFPVVAPRTFKSATGGLGEMVTRLPPPK